MAIWNGTVRQCDTVYHLGDFSLRFGTEYLSDILERLNGEIGLVCGSYWHGDRSFGHLANADLFERERLGRWRGIDD